MKARVAHVMTVASSLSFLTGQVAFMKKRGFEVAVVTSPDVELDAFGEAECVRVHGIEMSRSVTPLLDLRALMQLVTFFRDFRPHVVHAHTPKAGLLGMLAAGICGVRVRIYHMRGLPLMTATGTRRVLLESSERASCRIAHKVLCVSHSLRQVAVARELVRKEDIDVLAGGSGNGVDCDVRFNPSLLDSDVRAGWRTRLSIPSGAAVVGFVGRVVKDKGVEELASAWSSLRERYPAIHLVIAGAFEPHDPVSTTCRKQLERDSRVHFVGWIADMPALYAALDIVVLPSYREGLPNVPLEAAAMRLPVVATRIPGCTDAVLHDETGTLVPARDAFALGEALRRYVESPELRSRHGHAARERVVREFRPEAIWTALARLYNELLVPPP